MPEKKQGMIEKLKEVFKIKKPCNEDIITQAERVVSEYIAGRRCEIINKYRRKAIFINIGIFLTVTAMIYFIYRILV